ncbi:MAG: hypothetical protein K0R98_1783 [Rickettsiaceae bacterium]|jgi:hypothetical protein|nr:hypothetical protein [Rickettsiaceae bacterium]
MIDQQQAQLNAVVVAGGNQPTQAQPAQPALIANQPNIPQPQAGYVQAVAAQPANQIGA